MIVRSSIFHFYLHLHEWRYFSLITSVRQTAIVLVLHNITGVTDSYYMVVLKYCELRYCSDN